MRRILRKMKAPVVVFVVLTQTFVGPMLPVVAATTATETATNSQVVKDESPKDTAESDSPKDKTDKDKKEEPSKSDSDTKSKQVDETKSKSSESEEKEQPTESKSSENTDATPTEKEETPIPNPDKNNPDSTNDERPASTETVPSETTPTDTPPSTNADPLVDPAEQPPTQEPSSDSDLTPSDTVVVPVETPQTEDVTAPVLKEKKPISEIIKENKAEYSFESTEAGKISYQGSCQGDSAEASSGENKITFSNLAVGVHDDCGLTVADEAGNKSEPLKVSSFTYEETTLAVTVNSTKTVELSPTLSGSVSDPAAKVQVSVAGQSYPVDNKEGNWTLPAETINPPLSAGTYDIKAVATDQNNLVAQDSTVNELVVKAAAVTPLWITVDPLVVSSSTPVLSGRVSDPTATITITVGGNAYSASGSGGIWMVIANVPLSDGVYNVVATATLPGGITATDGTTNELTIDTQAPVVTVNTLITTNHYPEISGTIDDLNATLEISLNNGKTYYTVVKRPDHTWYLPAGTLPYINIGTYDIKARAIDRALNYGYDTTINELQIVFTLPAPIISQVTPVPTPSNNQNPSYTFHSDQIGVITYGGSCTSINTNAVVGNNTITFNTLSAGTYSNCTVTVTNNGVSSNILTVSPFTIDLTAPLITVNNLTTSNNQPNLSGTIDDPVASLSVTVNGATNAATNNGNGTWSVTWPVALPSGTYDVIATATDPAGNVGTDNTTNELTITPLVVITSVVVSPASAVLLASQTQQFTAQAYDGANNPVPATFTWSVDNAAVGSVDANGLFTATGVGTATVTANTNGITGTATVIVDTTPLLTEVTPVPTPTNNPTPDYTFSSDQTGTITYGGDCSSVTTNAVVGNNTITFNALTEGIYDNCTISVTNANGFGAALGVSPFTIDLTAPVVTVNTLVANTPTPTLTGMVNDLTATVNITVGGLTIPATVNPDNTWILTLTWPNALPDGVYDVVAMATDPAGNVGTDSTVNELTIDTTAPVVTVNSLTTNNNQPNLGGSIDDPTATINITINGTTYAATNNGDGTWSLIWPVALADGTYDVIATATDPAGNVGNDATTNELIVDTVTGVLSIIQITPTSSTLDINQTQQFTAQAYDGNNNLMAASFSWSLDNPAVGTIDSNGLFTATAAGTTTVTVFSAGITTTATVTVNPAASANNTHRHTDDEDEDDNTDPDIDHNPVRHALVGESIDIEAEADDDESGIDSVRIYYRISGQDDFTSHRMDDDGHDEYSYTIPAVFDASKEVHYYLRAIDEEGNENRLPNDGYYTIDILPSEGYTSYRGADNNQSGNDNQQNQLEGEQTSSSSDNQEVKDNGVVTSAQAASDNSATVSGAQDDRAGGSGPAGHGPWFWILWVLVLGGLASGGYWFWWMKKRV